MGAVLKEVRELRGISQEQLAHLAGAERSHISDLERGASEICLRMLVKVSEGLKMSPSTLLAWAEHRRKHLNFGPQEFQIPEVFLKDFPQREDEKKLKKTRKK